MLLNLLVSLEPTQMTPMPWNIHLQMEYSSSNLKKQDTLKIDGGALETMLPSFVFCAKKNHLNLTTNAQLQFSYS